MLSLHPLSISRRKRISIASVKVEPVNRKKNSKQFHFQIGVFFIRILNLTSFLSEHINILQKKYPSYLSWIEIWKRTSAKAIRAGKVLFNATPSYNPLSKTFCTLKHFSNIWNSSTSSLMARPQVNINTLFHKICLCLLGQQRSQEMQRRFMSYYVRQAYGDALNK